jgi:hypothetical protein
LSIRVSPIFKIFRNNYYFCVDLSFIVPIKPKTEEKAKLSIHLGDKNGPNKVKNISYQTHFERFDKMQNQIE